MLTGLGEPACATRTMPDPTQTGNLLRTLLALSFRYLPGISNIEDRFGDAQSPFQSIPVKGITENNNNNNKSCSFLKTNTC